MREKRVRIWTGETCNLKCQFCFYLDKVNNCFIPIEDIKKEMKLAKKIGCNHIDFSGGESSIRPDFIELIKYGKELGFITIGIITNGLRFSDMEYLKKCKEAGLNDILFSVHGTSKEMHEEITQTPGSFEKVWKAIENANELGIVVRFNITVTKLNYKHLEEYIPLILKENPLQISFIFMNDWNDENIVASHFLIKHSDATPYLKRTIDVIKHNVEYINVKYIPFCFMKGYEELICCHPQLKNDFFEWDATASSRQMACGGFKKYYPRLIYYFLKNCLIKGFWKGKYPLGNRIILSQQLKQYYKNDKCKECKYYHMCDGIENNYYDKFGDSELKCEKGFLIKDTMYYRNDFYNNLDPKEYTK